MGTPIGMFQHVRDVERYSPGQVIYHVGQPGEAMYVVLEGRVDLIRGDRLLSSVGPDEVFGEMALVDKGPRNATAVARTECVVAPVTERHFLSLSQHHPHFALDVLRVLAGRLRRERHSSAADSLAFMLA